MPKPVHILIHRFQPSQNPTLDDDGDEMNGFYYQFTDATDIPLGGLVGPYGLAVAAERAAEQALITNDF